MTSQKTNIIRAIALLAAFAVMLISAVRLAEAVTMGASVNNHRFYKVRESENSSIAKYYDEDANVVCYTKNPHTLTCVKL